MIRILIAEDEPLERRALKSIIAGELAGRAFEILEAATGIEALRLAIDSEPDLVFLDIEMPEISGLECLQSFRRAGISAPVVILTAYSRFAYAQKAIQLGVTDYLLKPISRAQLIAALRPLIPDLPDSGKPPEHSRAQRTVRFVTAFLEAHIKTSLTLEQVAERVGLSPAYVSRCFRLVTGNAFKEYLISFQIEYAKELLRAPGSSVTETARAVGYTDPNYFCKVFKKRVGVTPSDYRDGEFVESPSS